MKYIFYKSANIKTMAKVIVVYMFLVVQQSIVLASSFIANDSNNNTNTLDSLGLKNSGLDSSKSVTEIQRVEIISKMNACGKPDIGPDILICQGATVNKVLTAPAGAVYEWFKGYPPTQISTSQSITVTDTGRYIVNTLEPGSTNLIANGDFSQGNVGFTTGYRHWTTNTEFGFGEPLPYLAGLYIVKPNSPENSWADQFNDHTTGTGNYMFIDGNGVGGVKVWQQNITVVPGTNYIFSAWVRNLSPWGDSTARLNFDIGGTNVGGIYQVPKDPNPKARQWNQFYTTWKCPVGITSVTISLEDNTVTPRYNDFAIDDIEFRTNLCNSSDTVYVKYKSGVPPVITIDPILPVCKGMTVQLTASGAGPAGDYVWTPAQGLTSTSISNPVATVLATKTYTVTGTDANDCSNTASVTVTTKPGPVANLFLSKPYNIACLGSLIELKSTPNASYTYTYNQIGGPGGTQSGVNKIDAAYTQTIISQNYTLTVSDGSGCTDTDTLTVKLNSPQVNAGNDVSICGGTTLMNATSTVSGTTFSWSPATNLSATNIAGPTFTAGTTTNYTVTGSAVVKAVDGITNKTCTATDQVKVTVSPGSPVLVKANASKITICMGDAVTLFGSLGNGNPMVWDNGVTDNVSFKPTTTKTYTVSNAATSCAAGSTDQITVTVNPQPVVSGGSPQTVCPGTAVTLNGSGASTYSWDNGVSNNVAFTPLVTKTYTIIGTDGNGCKDTATVSVALNGVNNTPITATSSKSVICIGDPVTLNGQGGANYTWDNGVTDGVAFNPMVTQTYTVTSPATGCSTAKTATISVTVNQLPTVTAVSTAVCPGGATKLKGLGASTYTWSGGITDDVSFTVNTTTPYTVTGTDVNGCKNTGTATVTVNANPIISATGGAFCVGTTGVTLASSGAGIGATYTWTPATNLSNPGISNPVATPTVTTTYTVTGKDANGCTGTQTATVTVNPKPTISAIGGAYCENATTKSTTISASGAVGSSSYSWSPATDLSDSASANPIASPLTTTTYTVTGTDGNGCSNTATALVTIYQKPTISAIGGSVCFGDVNGKTLNASGAGVGGIYDWNPDATLSATNIFNPIATTNVNKTYTVTGTDANGCKNTATANVSINALPVVTANTPPIVCQFSPVTLKGFGALTYTWDNGVTDNVAFNANSNKTYTVTGTDMNGCKDTATAKVNIITAPDIPIIVTKPYFCQFSTPSLVTATTAQVGAIKWYSTASTASTSSPNPAAINTSILQTQEFWATNTIGTCESQMAYAKVNIVANPEVTAIVPPIICVGDTLKVDLQFTGIAPFTLNYVYQSNNATETSNSASKSLYLLPNVDGNMQFEEVMDKYCFTIYNNFIQNYAVYQRPKLTLTAKDTVCDQYNLNVGMNSNLDNTQFTWSYVPNATISGASDGSFTSRSASFIHKLHNTSNQVQDFTYVINTSTNGCVGESKPITVKVLPGYVPTLNAIGTVCSGTNVTLSTGTVPFGYTLQWFKNNDLIVNETSPTLHTVVDGNSMYIVEATSYCFDVVDAEVNSLVYERQHLTLAALDSCATYVSTLIAGTDSLLDNTKWNIGTENYADVISNHQSSVTHTFPEPGKYNVHIQGLLGTCLLADTVFEFVSTDCNVHLVNTFTPNDDQANDVWQIVGIEKQPQASLCIFNRWGVIIKKYDSHIPFNTWDGTNTEGQMVENATYYYVLDLKNNKKPIKGYVTLLTKLTAN